MQLKRIELRRFGCLEEFAADFQPGLNIVRGSNESGKSTLHQALLMALMLLPSQAKKYEPWRNWNSDQWYWLRLDFADQDGNTYRLIKDFESSSQELILPAGNSTKNRDAIDKILETAVGTRSLLVVQSTLCVAQDALADIANGRSEIAQSLESVVTGSEVDVHTEQALKKLERTIKDYKKGFERYAASPGPLTQARDRMKKLEANVQEYKVLLRTQESDVDALAKANTRLAEIEQEVMPLSVTLEQADKVAKISAQLEQYKQHETALDTKVEQASSALSERDKAGATLRDLGSVGQLTEEDKSKLDQLASRTVTLREEYARHQAGLEQYERDMSIYVEANNAYEKSREAYEADQAAYDQEWLIYEQQLEAYEAAFEEREQAMATYEAQLTSSNYASDSNASSSTTNLAMVFVGSGAVAGVAGILTLLLVNNIAIGGLLLGAGLLLAIIGLWRWRSAGRVGQPVTQPAEQTAPASSDPALQRPAPLGVEKPTKPSRQQPLPPSSPPAEPTKPSFDRQRFRDAEDELRRQLERLDCVSPEELTLKFAEAQRLRQQQQAAVSRLEGLLGDSTLEQLEEQRREVSRQRRDAEEILAQADLRRASAVNPVEYNQLQSAVQSLAEEQEHLLDRQRRLEAKLEQMTVSHEDLLQAEEALESAVQAFERAEMRLAVLELTQQSLQMAREETLQRAQERLGPATATYLQTLTNGRYENVWVDSNLGIELEDPARSGRRVSPDRLSRGTQDQLYMAARLALVDSLFPHTKPPILLDDPFVHFDPVRLAAAIDMCCDLSETRQILLFTCGQHYNDIGHHILMS